MWHLPPPLGRAVAPYVDAVQPGDRGQEGKLDGDGGGVLADAEKEVEVAPVLQDVADPDVRLLGLFHLLLFLLLLLLRVVV